MRPSFPALMHGLFWLVLAIILVLFAFRAFSMMDALESRMRQTTLLTGRLVEQTNAGLKDHERFLVQHDAIMQRQRQASSFRERYLTLGKLLLFK